jgi:hypothetical protein
LGGISDGVPPPKKIETTSRSGKLRLALKIGEQGAGPTLSLIASRTWPLKSQYGHFDRQNGQWM